MPIKVAINGFGRIGRRVLREALTNDRIQIVAVNDLTKPDVTAHLFKYDSVHGTLKEAVSLEGNTMVAGRHRVKLFAEKDPAALPWKDLGVDVVMECTGIFTDKEKASTHLKGGAKKVIISAPSKDADLTICMGINEASFDPAKHAIVSNASCTTNCLAPVVKVLDDGFGVVRGLMVTIHSYTNDQNVLDLPHKDLRRARAAALSMIPTTTGAAKAIGLVLPHLKGKLDGYAVRVPTPNVSMVDLTVELGRPATREEINAKFRDAAGGRMKGIFAVSDQPLVSMDFNGDTNSSTVDAALTSVIAGNLAKAVAWYDNESGFSARMVDLAIYLGSRMV
ncbi:MAG: type I glyceraldehyde-3-phosphate dehydrogenase [Deltaproteobacteria bacterium]|nr:type I glyceraldehyde-3-phosphate dehydrogenase [Deltaproteobacteria bacterium]